MIRNNGKESIRSVSHIGSFAVEEYQAEPVAEKPDPLKMAIKEALGVHRS